MINHEPIENLFVYKSNFVITEIVKSGIYCTCIVWAESAQVHLLTCKMICERWISTFIGHTNLPAFRGKNHLPPSI